MMREVLSEHQDLPRAADRLDREWTLQDPAPWRALAHAHTLGTAKRIQGKLRVSPEDFVVEEALGFAPDGEGEHQILQIRKRDLNTIDVARALARQAGCPLRDVGYCGLKDRQAITTQWFSLRVPGEVDWSTFDGERWQVLSVQRHRRKLRRGSHQENRFHIIIRDLEGPLDLLEHRLRQIRRRGVPNYFGEQRFGRGGSNLKGADNMLSDQIRVRDRQRRGLFLSAARSWMFNCVLSLRVAAETWDKLLPGDVVGLNGSRSIFSAPRVDGDLARRVQAGDIHPTGPLAGEGEPLTQGDPRATEQLVFDLYPTWRRGLADAGLRQERRSLRLLIPDLEWQIDSSTLKMAFTLPRGAFATSVLRECVDYKALLQS